MQVPIPDARLDRSGLALRYLSMDWSIRKPMRTVSLVAAKRDLSRLMREVEQGEAFLITRRGRPVARLVPHRTDKMADPDWAAAHRRMMARLQEGASLGGLRVEREQLHDC